MGFNSANVGGGPKSQDTVPDVTWWMVLIAVGFLILIPASWYYMLPLVYEGLVNELYRPVVESGPVIVVRSQDLAAPAYVLCLLPVLFMMVLVLIARPLKLSQTQANRLFKPFLGMALVGIVFAVLSWPAVWAVGEYLTNQEYHYCKELSQRQTFTLTHTYVNELEDCPRTR